MRPTIPKAFFLPVGQIMSINSNHWSILSALTSSHLTFFFLILLQMEGEPRQALFLCSKEH